MATPIVIACPDCSKQVKVGEEHIGKRVRCKGCGAVFPIKAPSGSPSASKPAAKKSAGPPPVPAAPPPEPAAAEPKAYTFEEDFDPNKYTLTETNDTLPRCPFCAMEMESQDARICLHCGYDVLRRQRPQVKKIYAPTFWEWTLWLLPGILCIVMMLIMWTWYGVFWYYIEEWMDESVFMEEKGPPATYIGALSPPFMRLYHFLIFAFVSWKLSLIAYRRLVINYRPPERKLKEDEW